MKSLLSEMPISNEGLIDNLYLQIEVLKSENHELRTDRNLYKTLFEDEIILRYGHNTRRAKGKTNPVFLKWMKDRMAQGSE